jgi:hypothetical protein
MIAMVRIVVVVIIVDVRKRKVMRKGVVDLGMRECFVCRRRRLQDCGEAMRSFFCRKSEGE